MAAGDREAAAAFVRRFQARVYGLAVAVVGVPAQAEEIAQETFVRAWRNAGGYDPRRGRVATWLLTIARNSAVDVLRLRRDVPVEPQALVAVLTAPGETEVDGEADRVADVVRVRDALRELPREQATAVVMSVFYGLTAGEIAEREKIPLGTAKTRIRAGLGRLRDRLGVDHG
ncbi:MAG: sigma-70 family RNA polymerase sigma factor [Micromonosporaceae bacterium]|nr:sigma-70 family RNA polymerase sigma factor [Micromonosporaceae bacterium]